jgi:hypothetical protein
VQAERQHNQKLVLTVVGKLSDMDMTLVGEEDATSALLEFEPVEIVRKLG